MHCHKILNIVLVKGNENTVHIWKYIQIVKHTMLIVFKVFHIMLRISEPFCMLVILEHYFSSVYVFKKALFLFWDYLENQNLNYKYIKTSQYKVYYRRSLNSFWLISVYFNLTARAKVHIVVCTFTILCILHTCILMSSI